MLHRREFHFQFHLLSRPKSLEKDDDTAGLVTSYVKVRTKVLVEKDTDTSSSGADVAARTD